MLMKQVLLALLACGLVWSQAPVKKSASQRTGGTKQTPAAGETAQNPGRWPLREIRIQGVKLLTPQQVVEISGLKVGALAGKVELDAARERIYATGCFDSVTYAFEPAVGGGIVATFEIRDVEQRGGWRLDRLPLDTKAFTVRAAKTLQGFGAEIPMTEIYTRRMVEVAEAMLKEKGVTETVVSKFEAGMKDGMIAVIQPKAPPPNISQVVFVGARAVPPQELQRAITDVAVGTPWSEQMFRVFLENAVRVVYDAQGRLRAKFPSITTEPSKTNKGVVVTVTVDEGPVFKLSKLVITGAPLSDEEVNQLGGDAFKNDVPVNLSVVGQAMVKVLGRLAEIGYLKATYHALKVIHDEDKTADLTVEVEPGAEYKMGRLDIAGLDIESEPAIRKMWVLKTGDPYRKGYAERFMTEVRERRILDFLGETSADVKLDDNNAQVNVRLGFKGGPQKLDTRPREKNGDLKEERPQF
jgi:outer membrane protein assembly factor BamA